MRADLVVVLDEVTDPHNVGAVARSAAAAGAGGLVLPRRRSAAVTPAVVKASAGVIEQLPVAQVTNVARFLEEAKRSGAWVYGAAGEAPTTLWELDLSGRLVLVFGAERDTLVPTGDVERTAAYYGTTVRWLPGIGHDVMLDAGHERALDAVLSDVTDALA